MPTGSGPISRVGRASDALSRLKSRNDVLILAGHSEALEVYTGERAERLFRNGAAEHAAVGEGTSTLPSSTDGTMFDRMTKSDESYFDSKQYSDDLP